MKNTLFFLMMILFMGLVSAPAFSQVAEVDSADLGTYTGKYRKGMRHGQGTCVWADGSKYEGMWRYDVMHGKGTFTYKGYRYEGDWQNGKRHGRGKLTFPDGSVYEGQFKENRIAGYGKMQLADGSTHEGVFKNGKASGLGKHVWASGAQYVGDWKNDQMHGNGTLVMADGTVQQGKFENGEYIPCDCGLVPTIEAAYKTADAVFVAEVLSIFSNEEADFDEIVLQITQFWKGEYGYNRKVFMRAGYSSCDVVFYEGESFLIFAKKAANGSYFTTKCLPSKPRLEANWEVNKLNEVVPCTGGEVSAPILMSGETDHVCGCDGNTYKNATIAQRSGVASWKVGKCEEQE